MYISSYLVDKAFVTIYDPELIKEFLTHQDDYEKEPYFVLNRIRAQGKGMAFKNGEEWRKSRKHISPVFAYEFYQTFLPVIQELLH